MTRYRTILPLLAVFFLSAATAVPTPAIPQGKQTNPVTIDEAALICRLMVLVPGQQATDKAQELFSSLSPEDKTRVSVFCTGYSIGAQDMLTLVKSEKVT